MVKTILNIAQFMELSVVAEGIEEEEEFRMLQQMNCHRYQGYYFCHPISFEEFGRCYREHAG
ncbi:EAL domain-containing protein, partial [Thiolapillus sp.]|uniref:EAL domain-containing protein n=6 Tax=Thiolapillus sp. TaxID=2017437 RepID=UPI003AF6639D